MIVRVPVDIQNAYWAAVAGRLDAGAEPGKLQLFSGEMPDNGGPTGAGHVLICELALLKPCAASIENGAITLASAAFAQILSAEPHGFARLVSGAGNWCCDLDTGVIDPQNPSLKTAACMLDLPAFSVGALLVPTRLKLSFPA
jgi:hypothetical protein